MREGPHRLESEFGLKFSVSVIDRLNPVWPIARFHSVPEEQFRLQHRRRPRMLQVQATMAHLYDGKELWRWSGAQQRVNNDLDGQTCHRFLLSPFFPP